MRISTKIFVGVLALSVAVNSYAFWGLLAPVGTGVMWLGRVASANVTMARAVEWSIYAHGAVIGFLTWKNSQDTTAQTSTPISSRLVVQPSSSAKRDNPDPKRFDDASTGRDPTPKTTYAGEADVNYSSSQPMGTLANSQPAGSKWTVAVSGSTTYTSYQSVPIATYSGSSDAQKCSSAQTATNPGTGWSWTCGGLTSSDGQSVGVWSKASPKTCAAGYTLSNGNCVLSDSTQVVKPSGKVPCEVVRNADGSWDVDAKNPECSGLASQLTASGKTLTYNKGDGNYDTIKTNADGTTTINTGNREITLGSQNPDSTYPITGITDNGPTGSTSTGSTGSGSTGTGSAVCGGPGLPACAMSVDDSGFQTKDVLVNAAGDAAKAKLDDRQAFIEGKASDNGNFGLNTSWIPSLLPGAVVTCQNLKWEPGIGHGPLAGIAGSIDINWCDKLDMLREYYAWLVGMLTVVAIALLFFGSNGNLGRDGK